MQTFYEINFNKVVNNPETDGNEPLSGGRIPEGKPYNQKRC